MSISTEYDWPNNINCSGQQDVYFGRFLTLKYSPLFKQNQQEIETGAEFTSTYSSCLSLASTAESIVCLFMFGRGEVVPLSDVLLSDTTCHNYILFSNLCRVGSLCWYIYQLVLSFVYLVFCLCWVLGVRTLISTHGHTSHGMVREVIGNMLIKFKKIKNQNCYWCPRNICYNLK